MNRWQMVLAEPGASEHIVQVYEDEAFLVEALAHFVRTGLARGEGIVVFATAGHWEGVVCRLAGEGVAFHDAESRGQLAVLDARAVLRSFMADGMPDWKAFQDVVGTVINLVRRKYPRVRAFGEMMDILWQRDQHTAALRLEELWNHLVKVQDLALCCAYRIDSFDEASYADATAEMFALHRHLVPGPDREAFEASVERASEALLGTRLTAMVRAIAAARHPPTEMPDAHSTLLWMKAHMPITAGKVLSCARAALRDAAAERVRDTAQS